MPSSSTIWSVLPEAIPHPSLENDPFWVEYERQANSPSIHIAILSNSYLELVLNRSKTIESRFSLYRRIPYERVRIGDVILLKQTSGPIKGVAYVSNVWFYKLENGTLNHIKNKFGNQLQVWDDQFWLRCEQLSYATLIELDHVRRISPIKYIKKNRNAWAIFNPTSDTTV